jgi:ribosomal protein S18 acetylase RimI-like enzyme
MSARSRFVVREAEQEELERVVSVLRAANAEFERVLPEAFYRPYMANVLDVGSRLDESELFVAEPRTGGAIVGAITFYPDASQEGWGWPAEWTGIRALAVESASRGLGIGRLLAQQCIERSRQLGASTVCLHTASFMRAAMAMYERVGFRRAPEFDRDAGEMVGAPSFEPPIEALAYRLVLSEPHAIAAGDRTSERSR